MLTIRLQELYLGRGTVAIAGPIDLELVAGEAAVILGPNGVGKSTLLRTLAGLLRPIAGSERVSGVDAPDGEPARTIAEVAHYVGHRNAMKPNVSVGGNLDFWRTFLKAGSDNTPIGNREALAALGLPDLTHLPFGYLSAGQQRRSSLARLLVVKRPVWILDEPTAALDAASQGIFANLMKHHLEQGGIVIAATHQPLGLTDAKSIDLGTHVSKADSRTRPGDAIAISEAELAGAEGWL